MICLGTYGNGAVISQITTPVQRRRTRTTRVVLGGFCAAVAGKVMSIACGWRSVTVTRLLTQITTLDSVFAGLRLRFLVLQDSNSI